MRRRFFLLFPFIILLCVAIPTKKKSDNDKDLKPENEDKPGPSSVPNTIKGTISKRSSKKKRVLPKVESNMNLDSSGFSKYGAPLPMKTSMETIKKNVMKYLNPSLDHQSYFPNDLEKHAVCDKPREAIYYGYKYKKKLGAGVQGAVYLMDNGTHVLALKKMEYLDNFLFQINTLAASTRNNGSLKLLGTMEGLNEKKNKPLIFDLQRVKSREGKFCYAMSYVEGKQLKKFNFKELGSGKDPASYQNLKRNYRLIILILRQLQILHFSFNEYPIQIETPIYGAYSFTMSHGDLHRSNIIVQNQTNSNYVPFLVDVGFTIYHSSYDHNEIFIQFYNKYLLEESFIGDRKGLTVHRLQLINSHQNQDFCMVLSNIILVFMGVKKEKGMNCRKLLKPFKSTSNIHRHQQLTVWKTAIPTKKKSDNDKNLKPENEDKPGPSSVPNTLKRTIVKKSAIKTDPKVESNMNLDSSGFSKYGAPLPMKTSMETIKKNVMKYLNLPTLRKFFYPRNLEKHEVCDTPIEDIYYGYEYKKVLGAGGQGVVYLMNNGTHDLALKRIPILDNFLIQINALAASTRNNGPLKLLGTMEGLYENNYHKVKYAEHHALSLEGSFCYTMSYVAGKELIECNFKELGSGKDPASYQNLKRNYRLIILILRQLQILHFSFNEYAMQIESPIYGAYSFTMSHGDLHRSNIIVQKRYDNYALFLIDMGFSIYPNNYDHNEIFIQFYNKYLLEESFLGDRKGLAVHRLQLINSPQSQDFCNVLSNILMVFMGVTKETRLNCRKLQEPFKSTSNIHLHQRLTLWKTGFEAMEGIITILQNFLPPFKTYSDTWANPTPEKSEHEINLITTKLGKLTPENPKTVQLPIFMKYSKAKSGICKCCEIKSNINLDSTSFGKSEAELPMTTSMDTIKKSMMRYLRPSKIHITYHPVDLEKENACDSPSMAEYKGYRYLKVLGFGVSSQVILMGNGTNLVVLKQLSILDDFLMQINILDAYTRNNGPIKLLGIMEGLYGGAYNTFIHNHQRVQSKIGRFCYITTYIRGTPIKEVKSLNEINIGKNSLPHTTMKKMFKLIILILRQLQILHFSFNEYPLQIDSPIYGHYSFTLSHGDLNRSNILTQTEADGSFVPFLVDAGFNLYHSTCDHNEIFLQFYNKYLLRESFTHYRLGLAVHKLQMINSHQNHDFCMILADIILGFMEYTPDIHLRQPLSVWKTKFKHMEGIITINLVKLNPMNPKIVQVPIFKKFPFAKDKVCKSISCWKIENNINLRSSTFGKSARELPMTTSNKKIETEVMQYIKPSKRHQTYYPPNLERHIACDNPNFAEYYGYQNMRQLGSGLQGKVVLMANGSHYLALKQLSRLDDFLIQINALAASTRNGGPLKLLGIMQGFDEDYDTYTHIQQNVKSKLGRFCYAMTYVQGVPLVEVKDLKETGSGKDPISYERLKLNYKLIILMLRQLQRLHFSFNEYPLQIKSPIYGAYSFTMSHGDAHRRNILIQRKADDNYVPFLVDVGFSLYYEAYDHNEIFIQFYNKYLLDELFTSDRYGLAVHRLQLINSHQNDDLCSMLINILLTFMGVTKEKQLNCRMLREIFKFTPDIHAHQQLSLWKTDFESMEGIITVFQKFLSPFNTYSSTWVPLQNYLQNFD
ncbi:hypothetical protein SNEBB_003597 [Seison nebaliae]|nr:hypothetical protein SNEBB_003597 [Seison nebaliae]